MEAQDFEDALAVLADQPGLTPVGRRWRTRATDHVCQAVDRALRERSAPTREQAMLVALKQAAHELKQAGEELERAARELKNRGAGTAAGVVHQASKRALAAADGLDG